MTHETANRFRFVKHESVHGNGSHNRSSRWAARAIAAILSVGLAVMPIGPAFAGEQVLEIPQVASVPATRPSSRKHTHVTYSGREAYSNGMPDSKMDATAGEGGPTDSWDRVASNEKSYAPEPNVGSISDYQNQQGENAQPPGIAFGGGARRNEPQSSMTTNLIVGGLIVGLVALEIASHHHHR
jgi:hypothetical protein